MTKNEILEAINATIAPNGVKGITAESLANLLTEIVNATPEGGGGSGGSGEGNGALVVYDLNGYGSKADNEEGLEDVIILYPQLEETVNKIFSLYDHNAAIYAQLTTLMEEGKPAPLLMMDYGYAASMMLSMQLALYPDIADNIDSYGLVASEPMMCLRHRVTGPIADEITTLVGGNTDFFALVRPSEFDLSTLNDMVITSDLVTSGYFLAEDGSVTAITPPTETE